MPPEVVDSRDQVDHARISDVTGIAERTVLGAGQEPAVLGDGRARRAVDRHRALSTVVRLGDQHRQRHPQLRALRDAWRSG